MGLLHFGYLLLVSKALRQVHLPAVFGDCSNKINVDDPIVNAGFVDFNFFSALVNLVVLERLVFQVWGRGDGVWLRERLFLLHGRRGVLNLRGLCKKVLAERLDTDIFRDLNFLDFLAACFETSNYSIGCTRFGEGTLFRATS